jgi:GntR family transcriptional regulator, transcriptional repressor for pyruvate dehydrogenase complex
VFDHVVVPLSLQVGGPSVDRLRSMAAGRKSFQDPGSRRARQDDDAAWGREVAAGQMRQLRLAELVAGVLREHIVSGDLEDGDLLPGLDKLVKEFAVSPPSVREALRILENEGLLTVRRGNVGGAVVHRPRVDAAAYMLGLVMQAEGVPAEDLAVALGHLETLCVRLCASRPDRRRAVVPRLRRLYQGSERTIEDPVAFEQSCQEFHDGLVMHCGNRSIVLTVTAVEWLWRAQPGGWAHRVTVLHEYPEPDLRRDGLGSHLAILTAIEKGDAEKAEQLTREHIENPRIRNISSRGSPVVRATDVRRTSSMNGDPPRLLSARASTPD